MAQYDIIHFISAYMGIGESKIPEGAEEEPAKINHERFANRQILRNQEGDQSIAISVAVPSEKEYKAWTEELAKLGNNDSLLLPVSHSFQKSGFCGSAGVVKIVYENYPFILSDEIHNRECLSAKYFEENQLWYLALTLLSAVQEFHAKGKKAGDVRPMNVFISQDGTVKLACHVSWPLEITNYEKSFEKQATYLAPQEVVDLAYAKTEPSGNFELAETFSVGLTLLDAATLSDSVDLYKSVKQIDYQGLEARLKLLASRPYGNPLVQLITNMCETSPDSRTSAKELLEWLTPYEYAINNFAEFLPETLPAKFNKSGILPSDSGFNSFFNPKPYVSAYSSPPMTLPMNPAPITYFTSPSTNSTKPQQISSSIPTNGYSTTLPQSYFPSIPGVVQSTYVPFSSNFSLQKIDEQLQQSRKMFPS